MSRERARTLRFGDFEVDPAAGELRRGGVPVNLPPQPARVLAFLAGRPGEVVTREEIQAEIWGQETHVDFVQGLNYCIRQIRMALGDDASSPRYVETLPRRGYRFVGVVEAAAPAGGPAPKERIMFVVLPFENLGGDPEQEYFSDGLTDEMITELGRACPDRLGVIARTSSMKYKGTGASIDQISRELGVQYALEGTVRRSGERVRIGAQLIDVADRSHVWAHSYETSLRDILAVQSEVARDVSAHVQQKLVSDIYAGPARPALAAGAYEAYLKGRYFWHRRSSEDLRNSIRYFEEAIAKDPDYAEAYAGLADAHLTLLDYFMDPREAMANAASAVAKSLSLNDSLAEPHTSLAHASMHGFDWRTADRAFRRTFELNPSYAPAWFYYSNYKLAVARFAEALRAARRAVELDPISAVVECNEGTMNLYAGRYDEAERHFRHAMEMDSNLWAPQYDLARLFEERGDQTAAVKQFRRVAATSKGSPRTLASLGRALALQGAADEASDIRDKLERLSREMHVSAYYMALLCAALGERERAFEHLEVAYQRKDGDLIFIQVDKRHQDLRDDDRFRSIVHSG